MASEALLRGSKATPSSRFRRYVPAAGFGANIVAFAAAAEGLQEKRHSADYDVMTRMNRSDALLAISTARAALGRFDNASQPERLAFLSLLLFPPRA
jgi:hypothetical protein